MHTNIQVTPVIPLTANVHLPYPLPLIPAQHLLLNTTMFENPQTQQISFGNAQPTINELQQQIVSLQASLSDSNNHQNKVLLSSTPIFNSNHPRYVPEAQHDILEYDADLPSVMGERFLESVENARIFYSSITENQSFMPN